MLGEILQTLQRHFCEQLWKNAAGLLSWSFCHCLTPGNVCLQPGWYQWQCCTIMEVPEPPRSHVKWKPSTSLIFHCNSSIHSWTTQLERERGSVGGVTGGDVTTDGVPASVAKLSLLKPSLSGSQPAAGPLQGGWWGFWGG